MNRTLEEKLGIERLEVLMQPIVSPNEDLTAGVEALSRGIDAMGHVFTFMHLSERAVEEYCVLEMELTLLRMSLEGFESIKSQYKNVLFFVNISDHLMSYFLDNDTLIQWIDAHGLPHELLVFDINQNANKSMPTTKRFIEKYKAHGIHMCLDDMGSNYRNLDKVLYLQPDMIKLNISDLSKLDCYIYREQMPKFLKRMADQFGILIIAKKVSTEMFAMMALEMGIQFMQGEFVSSPVDLESRRLDELIEKYRLKVSAHVVDENKHTDFSRMVTGKCINILRGLSQMVKQMPFEEVENHAKSFFDMYPMIQNIWFLTPDGLVKGKNLIYEEEYAVRNLPIYHIYNEGADFSKKEHYYQLKNSILDVWLTMPFKSILTNALCIGGSVDLGSDYEDLILCVNINYDAVLESVKKVEE